MKITIKDCLSCPWLRFDPEAVCKLSSFTIQKVNELPDICVLQENDIILTANKPDGKLWLVNHVTKTIKARVIEYGANNLKYRCTDTGIIITTTKEHQAALGCDVEDEKPIGYTDLTTDPTEGEFLGNDFNTMENVE